MPTTTPQALKRLRKAIKPALLLLIGWVVIWFAVPALLPIPDALLAPPEPAVEVLSRDGETLRRPLGGDGMRRSGFLALDEIPEPLVKATLAAEDKRFWDHGGVDVLALARAAGGAVQDGEASSGASTITQQLVKIARGRGDNRWLDKIAEIFLARKLELSWGKRRILEEYLNRLDYGNLRSGVGAAAQGYFGKPASDLSLAESAFLAGLPQAPGRLNPYRDPGPAQDRARWILGRLKALGWAEGDALARAEAEPVALAPRAAEFEAPHLVDMLADAAGGIRGAIHTTVDLRLQRFAESALRRRLAELARFNARHGAVVVIDNASGGVLALVGSPDYADPDGGQINGALAPRSPGSALKPFAYLLALESGFTAASVLPDLPREYATPTGLYEPRNYSGQFYGPIPLREALGNSLNVSAVHLLNQIGGAEPFAEALQRAGLTTLTEEPEHYGLGLVIGNAEVRLLELANAYACLARLGAWKPYRLDRAGDDPPPVQIFDRDAAWLVADILADNAARARAFSAWSALRMGFPVACKTGTSTDFRDSWAFGYTPEFTAGVWIGNFDGTPMQDVASIRGPAPVLREVIGELRARFGTGWFERPAGIRRAAVDPVLGLRLPADHPRAAGEWFLPGTEPRLAKTEDDYDPNGRPILPYEYRRWLAGTDNWLGASAIARTEPDRAAPLEIRNPLPGTVIFLDPDLPGSGSAFPLEANRAVRWASATLEIDGDLATVKPGRHAITATDAQTGEVSETWIEVRGAR